MSYAAELCGSKLRAKLGATLNESASEGVSSNSFAARQMAKMGWTEGTGLGKNRDGMKSHIKVNKREENVGLGQEKELAKEVSNTWWKSNVSSTLERLQQKQPKKKKSSKKKKTEFTDQELFQATGGARFGMRAQRRAEGKWKRTETISSQTETEAKNKIEWNGLGKAKVLLASNDENHIVSAHASEVGSSSGSEEEPEVVLPTKKRKRTAEGETTTESKKKKKSSKKDKKKNESQTDNEEENLAKKSKDKKKSKSKKHKDKDSEKSKDKKKKSKSKET
jgi:Pin2-interacting protein X1